MFKTMNWSSVFHLFKIRGGEPPGQYFLKGKQTRKDSCQQFSSVLKKVGSSRGLHSFKLRLEQRILPHPLTISLITIYRRIESS